MTEKCPLATRLCVQFVCVSVNTKVSHASDQETLNCLNRLFSEMDLQCECDAVRTAVAKKEVTAGGGIPLTPSSCMFSGRL